MNTSGRNHTVHFSREEEDYNYNYEGQKTRSSSEAGEYDHHFGIGNWRSFPRRYWNSPSHVNRMIITNYSYSYRRDRARRRQIFLKTYKLAFINSRARGKMVKSTNQKLKKFGVKVKSAVITVLAFVRGGALRSCSSRFATRASSPSPVIKCC